MANGAFQNHLFALYGIPGGFANNSTASLPIGGAYPGIDWVKKNKVSQKNIAFKKARKIVDETIRGQDFEIPSSISFSALGEALLERVEQGYLTNVHAKRIYLILIAAIIIDEEYSV